MIAFFNASIHSRFAHLQISFYLCSNQFAFRYDTLSHTSDYFEELRVMAVKMIKSGDMYADDTPVEKMREVYRHALLEY